MMIQIEILDFESAHKLLNDVFISVLSIKEALNPMVLSSVGLSKIEVSESENRLFNCLKSNVMCFSQGQTSNYHEQLNELNDSFKVWKHVLLVALTPVGYH